MHTFTTLLTFMVLALTLNFCGAAPLTNPSHDLSAIAEDLVNTTLLGAIAIDPITNGTDDTENRCYKWDYSEKWRDVGGQFSAFVNQSVYDLCQLIAIDAYKGFSAGSTVSSTLSNYPAHGHQSRLTPANGRPQIKHCKEVRKGSQGKNYDRSIGISLRYRGPQLQFHHLTAGYCFDRMEQPMECGAGGEWDQRVYNPDLPKPWVSDRWETKADPNRGDCRHNGYNSDLQ